MANFHYKKGNIETVIPWAKPCPHNLISLIKNHFHIFNDLDIEYEYYIWSNFLFTNSSWDIDLFLVGPPTPEVGDAMVEFCNIAHDPPYKQLVDFTLIETTKVFKTIEPFNRTKDISHAFFETGGAYYKPHGMVRKNGKEISDDIGVQIHPNLWKKDHVPYPKKILDRKHLAYPIRLDHFIRLYERINL